MKTENTTVSVSVAAPHPQSDSTKLASLLALAAGAVAMPQTGHADIIYTDLSANPVRVGYLGGGASYELDIPGTARFGFERFQTSVTTTSPFTTTQLFRAVVGTDLFGTATVQIQFNQQGPNRYAVPFGYGAAWNQGLPLYYTALVGVANTSFRNPNAGYDHMYLGFRFQDSTAGNAFRYGWIEVGLSIAFVNPFGSTGGPEVTIYGYAFDNTGAQPTMGQRPAVPEPSSAALLIFGALALGAPGLRKWRKDRDAVANS